MDENKNVISEFAIAGLAIALISFVNLAGIEKAILAIIFGTLALKRIKENDNLLGIKFARAGIILAFLSMLISIYLLVKFYPKFKEIINQIQAEQTILEENGNSRDRQQSERIPGTKLF